MNSAYETAATAVGAYSCVSSAANGLGGFSKLPGAALPNPWGTFVSNGGFPVATTYATTFTGLTGSRPVAGSWQPNQAGWGLRYLDASSSGITSVTFPTGSLGVAVGSNVGYAYSSANGVTVENSMVPPNCLTANILISVDQGTTWSGVSAVPWTLNAPGDATGNLYTNYPVRYLPLALRSYVCVMKSSMPASYRCACNNELCCAQPANHRRRLYGRFLRVSHAWLGALHLMLLSQCPRMRRSL